MKQLLLSREYQIEGNWNRPLAFLTENFKSVEKAVLMQTSRSAGYWEGIFAQKLHGTYYAILFSQENNYPNGGFTLRTNYDIIASSSRPFTTHELETIYSELVN